METMNEKDTAIGTSTKGGFRKGAGRKQQVSNIHDVAWIQKLHTCPLKRTGESDRVISKQSLLEL